MAQRNPAHQTLSHTSKKKIWRQPSKNGKCESLENIPLRETN
jgi:hypothetical protein